MMRLNFGLRFLSIIILSTLCLSASIPTVTLYPPRDPVTKKYDEGTKLAAQGQMLEAIPQKPVSQAVN